MRQKDFAKTGRKVSEIGMGTYYDPLWIASAYLGWKRRAREKVEALKAGLSQGITLLDTAEIYRSEPLVAKSMLDWRRDEIFLATKVWSNHLHRDDLIRAFERSLRRLGTKYIDLYQVHFPNPSVPIEETMGAMEKLVADGKLLHIGVSNFNLEQIKDAQAALPKSELSSVQLDYSLIHRNIEVEILPHCDREKIALLAYYPLGHGKLPMDTRLEEVAGNHSKTKAQAALRWLAAKANVFPIPRASKVHHVVDNAGGSGWAMTDEEISELEKKFP